MRPFLELDCWFGRSETPLWITEYAHEAAPAEPRGVPPELQAAFAAQALEVASTLERVRLFVWFTFRDDHERLAERPVGRAAPSSPSLPELRGGDQRSRQSTGV